MSEQDRETAGQHLHHGVQGGAYIGKGLDQGRRGQHMGTDLDMPIEGPPGPSSVSPPPATPSMSSDGDAAPASD